MNEGSGKYQGLGFQVWMGKVYHFKVCHVSFKFFFFFNFCFTFVETGSGDVVKACLEFMILLHQPLGAGSLNSNGFNHCHYVYLQSYSWKVCKRNIWFQCEQNQSHFYLSLYLNNNI